MATRSSILAWRIPWTEEPGGLQSVGSQESETTEWLHFPQSCSNGRASCLHAAISLAPSSTFKDPCNYQGAQLHNSGKLPHLNTSWPATLISLNWTYSWGFPGGSAVKNPSANARDIRDEGLTPGLGRSCGEGNGTPLQYSRLGNPMEGGAWQLQSMGLQSQTQLKRLSTYHSHRSQASGHGYLSGVIFHLSQHRGKHLNWDHRV